MELTLTIYKRPILVWVIILWSSFLFFGGILNIYKLDNANLLEGMDKTNLLNLISGAIYSIVFMFSSILLFMRRAINRWVFLVYSIVLTLHTLYTLIFIAIHSNNLNLVLILSMLNISLYVGISIYSFKLMKSDYYMK